MTPSRGPTIERRDVSKVKFIRRRSLLRVLSGYSPFSLLPRCLARQSRLGAISHGAIDRDASTGRVIRAAARCHLDNNSKLMFLDPRQTGAISMIPEARIGPASDRTGSGAHLFRRRSMAWEVSPLVGIRFFDSRSRAKSRNHAPTACARCACCFRDLRSRLSILLDPRSTRIRSRERQASSAPSLRTSGP
jgi:hypothetical protein